MSDGGPTWLGLGPGVLLPIATAIGMAIMGAARWIGGLVSKSRLDENAARDRETAAVNASRERENAVLVADNQRLREALDKVGAEKDALAKVQLRMAAAILLNRANPKVANEFEEAYPSAVTNMADLLDPNAQHKHDPVLDATLRSYADTTPPKFAK